MTKADLVQRMQARYPELSKHTVEDVVTLFFSEIVNALQKGNRVELRGFGSFCLRKRPERLARNPKTGEQVQVEEKLTPFFKAGKGFREFLNRKEALGRTQSPRPPAHGRPLSTASPHPMGR